MHNTKVEIMKSSWRKKFVIGGSWCRRKPSKVAVMFAALKMGFGM